MKKFLIYLSSILLLFGISVAFADDYIEDFEDYVLDPEWIAEGNYEIIPDSVSGSTVLHMNRACDDCGGVTTVITSTGELIYHFAADIYLSTSNPWADVNLTHSWEPDNPKLWAGNHLDLVTGRFNVFVILYDSNGQELVNLRDILEEYNAETWYSLSITINDGCVTFGIDGIETNLCDELIQKPDSGLCHGSVQVWSDDDDGFVDYSVDNLVAYSSTETTIDEILTFFNDGFEAGTIVGRGNWPGIANFRLWLMQAMLQTAAEFIDQDRIGLACFMLNSAHRRCDGEPSPSDFIEGEAVSVLMLMIEGLMAQLGCD